MIFALAPFLMIPLWVGLTFANTNPSPQPPDSFVTVKNSDVGRGLIFSFSESNLGFSAFVRKGFFWLVFPSSNPFSMEEKKFPLGFGKPEISKVKNKTVLRLKIPEDVYPLIKHTQDQVEIFLNTRPLSIALPLKSLSPDILKIDFQKKQVLLQVPHTDFIDIEDPETLEKLIIVPISTPESGFLSLLKKRDFTLCPTLQGLLIEAKPEVEIQSSEKNLIITRTGGLQISPPQDQAFASQVPLSEKDFPFSLVSKQKNLEEEIARALGSEKLSLLWEQIQQQISYGELTEASTQLALLARDHPEFEKLRLFQITKGLSLFFKNQLSSAFYTLSNPFWEKEIRPWIEATRLKNGEIETALTALEKDLSMVSRFHPVLQGHLLLIGAQGSVHIGQAKSAHKFLLSLPKSITSEQKKYAKALLQQLMFDPLLPGGPAPQAEPNLTKNHQWLRHEAQLQAKLETILTGYRVGRFTPSKTLEEVQKIQWESRNPIFESQVLKNLGELYETEKEISKGLESYARFLKRFKGDQDYDKIENKALKLYHEALLSPDLPFYKRFVIFKRFEKKFLSQLEDKEEILSHFIKKLIDFNLLEDSLTLLSQQESPFPEDILKLANAYLEHKHPEKIFTLLEKYEKILPEDTGEERLALRTNALKQMGRFQEALSLIPEDETPAHLLERASLLMEKKAWQEAIPLLEKVIENEKNPDIEIIESLAISLYHAKNNERLKELLTAKNQKRSFFLKTLAETSSSPLPKNFQELRESLNFLKKIPNDFLKNL